MSKTKILIVEDEFIIAEKLRFILQDLEYEVIGIASKYSKALSIMEEQLPDLILIDIVLAGAKDGIELAHQINLKHKKPFIFITSHSDIDTVKRAKDVKPNGYLVKPFKKADIFTTIEIALANNVKDSKLSIIMSGLSGREGEVYSALLEGKTDQEISDKLFITVNTVKTHLKSIFIKLNVKNRLEAVTFINI
jgi:DNA-binding NarL/FixJ family response regulator